jgi:ribose transport system permease protein
MELARTERNQASLAARMWQAMRALALQQEFSIIFLFFVLLLFFYSRNTAMLNLLTITSVLRTMAFPGLVAMGLVQLMIAGEIDLSTGSMMSLSAVFTAKLIRDVFLPAGLSNGNAVVLAVVCALGVAVLVGLFNSFVVVRIGVPAVIATIGTQFIVRGISYSFTNGLPIYPLPPEVAIIGSWKPLGLSFTFFLMLGVTVVVQILLFRTRWGTALFATGGNKLAAQVCGINTDRIKTICFVLTSLLAAMAGLLTMSQLPQTPGDPIIGRFLDLDILAGVVIGGVSFFGGRGSAIGTFFGVMFIQMVRSGIVVGHFDSYIQAPALGAMLLLAAVVDVVRHLRREG